MGLRWIQHQQTGLPHIIIQRCCGLLIICKLSQKRPEMVQDLQEQVGQSTTLLEALERGQSDE